MDENNSKYKIDVLIKQDVFPGLPFEVSVNGEPLVNTNPLGNIRRHSAQVDSLPCEVVMELIPEWKREDAVKKDVAGLGRSSGVFKSVYNQLPLEAHRVETVNEGDDPELRFKASTLLKLDEDAMWVWRRSAVFQEAGIEFILAVLALVVVLAVEGTLKFVLAPVFVVVLVILGILQEKRRRKTIKALEALKKE